MVSSRVSEIRLFFFSPCKVSDNSSINFLSSLWSLFEVIFEGRKITTVIIIRKIMRIYIISMILSIKKYIFISHFNFWIYFKDDKLN